MVTSGKDKKVIVWFLQPYKGVKRCSPLAIGTGHTDSVGTVCICQNKANLNPASKATFIISGGGDKIIKRWMFPAHLAKIHSGDDSSIKLNPSHSIRAHDKDINHVSISPNDAIVASGSQDKTIKLWNAKDLTLINTLKGHKRGVWKVAFSPIDKVLVSCSSDRTLKLWSMNDYSLLRTFEGHTASVLCVKFINKGNQLLSGSADGLLRLWTIRTGECEGTFDAHADKIWAIDAICRKDENKATKIENEKEEEYKKNEDDFLLISCGSDSKIVVWKDYTSLREIERIRETENLYILEQQLAMHLKNKNYHKALDTALTLNHSLKVLRIFTAILDEENLDIAVPVERRFKCDWSKRLDNYLINLQWDKIEQLVGYLVEWNTNAKYTYPCQLIIHSLLRVFKIEKFSESRVISNTLSGLISYTQRHYARLDKLHQATYVLDYVSSLLSLTPLDSSLDSESEVLGKSKSLERMGEKLSNSISTNESSHLKIFSNVNYNDNSDNDSLSNETVLKSVEKSGKNKRRKK